MSEDRKSHAEQLLSLANDAAHAVGKRFVTFLLAGVYVGVTVISTSDATLVHGALVTLPLLNVDVPLTGIFGFFSVAPWLILFLHCDLLLQMWGLSRKLGQFRRASAALAPDERAQMRERLASFYYVQFLVGEGSSRVVFVLGGVVLRLAVIALPLALLLGVQVRFLPFHSAWMTWSQRAAVLADVGLLLLLWPRLLPRPEEADEHASHGPRWLAPLRSREFATLATISLATVAFCLQVASIPDAPGRGWWFKQRNLQLQNEILTSTLTAKTVNQLRDGGAGEKAEALALVSPLTVFQGRDLRYGNFFNAILPKFDFRSARTDSEQKLLTQLQGANFSWAQLQEVKMDEADARNAFFDGAQMQGSFLINADLRGASLIGAQLQQAHLQKARLAGAKAIEAKLQGADLPEADLSGADLSRAQLQGANLRGANLTGAILNGAILDGANLERATLTGAKLQDAQLKGVSLLEAVVDGADFNRASFDLTDVLAVSRAVESPLAAFAPAHFNRCTTEQSEKVKCTVALPQDQYVHELGVSLVELGCTDPYIAFGLTEQARDSREARSADQSRLQLAAALGSRLADESCEGVKTVDRSVRRQLARDARQATSVASAAPAVPRGGKPASPPEQISSPQGTSSARRDTAPPLRVAGNGGVAR